MQPRNDHQPPPARKRKRRRIFYLFYLLTLLVGGLLIYRLIPADVKEALRDTYLNPDHQVYPSPSETDSP